SIQVAIKSYLNALISTNCRCGTSSIATQPMKAKTLVVVDQPNNIGRLTVAVAQDIGVDVRYLPGLAMRQLSRIHAGNSKTDVRDAYIIAYAGKYLPESLRQVDRVEEEIGRAHV